MPIHAAKPHFQFFENAGPYLRVPVVDKIKILSKFCPLLLNGRSSELDLERSWFSIYWHPILSDYNLTQPLSGSFLTYHSFELVGRSPFRLSSVSPIPSARLQASPQRPTGMAFTSSPSEGSSKESDESPDSSPTMKISSRSSNLSSRNSSQKHRKHKKSKSSDTNNRCYVCASEIYRDLKKCGKTHSSHSLEFLLFGGERDKRESRFYVGILGFICHNVWEATWNVVENKHFSCSNSQNKHFDSRATRSVSPTNSTLSPFYYSKGYASYKEILHEKLWNNIDKSKTLHPDFIFMTRHPITS